MPVSKEKSPGALYLRKSSSAKKSYGYKTQCIGEKVQHGVCLVNGQLIPVVWQSRVTKNGGIYLKRA